MNEFDPLHKWLAIPPAEQPPHYYRLLGITLFEEDPEVIATAADRQMAHIKSFASGPHAAHSQWCLNELSKARVCLLSARMKEVYDERLSQQLARDLESMQPALEPALAPEPIRPPTTPSVPTIGVRPSSRLRSYRRRRHSSLLPLSILVAALAAVGGLLYYAKMTAPKVANQNASEHATAPSATSTPASPTPVQATPVPPPVANRREPTVQRRTPIRLPQRSPQQGPNSPPQNTFTDLEPEPDQSELDDWLDQLPEAIRLPEVSDGSVAIWEPPSDKNLTQLAVTLDCPSYFSRLGQRPTIVVLDSNQPDECYVFDEPEALLGKLRSGAIDAVAEPVALISLAMGEFKWLEGAASQSRADRLRSCRLVFDLSGSEQLIQLSQPHARSLPIVVGDWEEAFCADVTLDELPVEAPVSELRVSLQLSEDWPLSSDARKLDVLTIDSDVRIGLWGATDAGVGAYWKRTGNTLKIYLAPGFGLKSAPNETFVLSSSVLAKTEKSMERALRNFKTEYNRRTRGRAKLQANLIAANNFNTRIPGGGTTVPLLRQKQALIAAAQAEIAANEARISEVATLGQTLQRELEQEIPKLRTLATTLQDKAQAWITVYLPTDAGRVVLFTTKNGDAE